MIPLDTFGLASSPSGSAVDEARDALRRLLARDPDGGRDRVLSLTWFVAARDADTYVGLRRMLGDEVRAAWAGGTPPPVSVVAQAPATGLVSLEATTLAGRPEGVRVVRASAGGLVWTRVECPAGRQVHAGGIASSPGRHDPEAESTEAFEQMETVLDAEGLDYGHVVRQWNYIERMLEPGSEGPADCQRYQIFNDVRTLAYARSAFPCGYPAATGIGQATGGVHVEFIALDAAGGVVVEPISNPRQIDAHRYSTDVLVGRPARALDERTPPKFERAKRVSWQGGEMVFVSGTAAILGERSIGLGDPVAQTRTTLDHIEALLDGAAPTYLRAYVKRAEDIPAVRRVCQATCGLTPVTYVQADVCRGELLVEIEGLRVRVT